MFGRSSEIEWCIDGAEGMFGSSFSALLLLTCRAADFSGIRGGSLWTGGSLGRGFIVGEVGDVGELAFGRSTVLGTVSLSVDDASDAVYSVKDAIDGVPSEVIDRCPESS